VSLTRADGESANRQTGQILASRHVLRLFAIRTGSQASILRPTEDR